MYEDTPEDEISDYGSFPLISACDRIKSLPFVPMLIKERRGVPAPPYMDGDRGILFGANCSRENYPIGKLSPLFVDPKKAMKAPKRKKGDQNGATKVALPKRAAQCMSQLLDYIYTDKLDLKAECAPPLRYLANQFDVRELYAQVSSFVQNYISESTITTYIRQAEAVKGKELLSLGMTVAAAKFDTIPDDSLLLLQRHVFQQLTSNVQLNCPTSERLSQRVAVYTRGRSEEINDEVFYFMTHAQILPRICPTEAVVFELCS